MVSAGRAAAPVDPGSARAAARTILGNRRFRNSPTPRPLRKPLGWLGDRIHGIGHWIGSVLSHVPAVLLLAIGLLVVVLGIAYVVRRVGEGRGSADARRRSGSFDDGAGEDPEALEREAEAAERSGELDRAVRLRFRAGLLRLGDRGAIRYRPSVTTNEVRRVLGSDTFEELARTFEAIAYGGREAEPPDVDAARREWPRVVAGATRPQSESNRVEP